MITPFRVVATAFVLLLTGLFTTIGQAQDPRWDALREDSEIEEGLLVIMVGTFIVNGCEDISVRRLRSTPYMMGLARRASDIGYSRSEIEQFIDDPLERARVEREAEAYLAQNNATRSDAASLCRLGRDEISAGSTIGRMLRQG